MGFWSTGVLPYKLALQYSITPILQEKIRLSCQKNMLQYHMIQTINDSILPDIIKMKWRPNLIGRRIWYTMESFFGGADI